MISVVSAHLCFDEWHPSESEKSSEREGEKTQDDGKHLETAQIDGVMMSCRSVWAKRFIEFNHSTLIFFWSEIGILKEKRFRCLYALLYTFYLAPFLSFFFCFFRLFCFFTQRWQNNLQNGWNSAYLQWVKWRCCIVVVKWFYCLISIHKIAYEIHFVGGDVRGRIYTHTEWEQERENGGA